MNLPKPAPPAQLTPFSAAWVQEYGVDASEAPCRRKGVLHLSEVVGASWG